MEGHYDHDNHLSKLLRFGNSFHKTGFRYPLSMYFFVYFPQIVNDKTKKGNANKFSLWEV